MLAPAVRSRPVGVTGLTVAALTGRNTLPLMCIFYDSNSESHQHWSFHSRPTRELVTLALMKKIGFHEISILLFADLKNIEEIHS